MGPRHDLSLCNSAWRAKRRVGEVDGEVGLKAAARIGGRVVERRVRARVEKCMVG